MYGWFRERQAPAEPKLLRNSRLGRSLALPCTPNIVRKIRHGRSLALPCTPNIVRKIRLGGSLALPGKSRRGRRRSQRLGGSLARLALPEWDLVNICWGDDVILMRSCPAGGGGVAC